MKCLLRYILLLLPLLGGNALRAQLQLQAFLDSLLKELPKQKEDTNKVNLLDGLSKGYTSINPDEGIKYGRMGLALATKLGWEMGKAKLNANLGVHYQTKADYPSSIEYSQKSLAAYEEIGDKNGIASVTGSIGNIYKLQGDYPSALEYYSKSLKMDEEYGFKQHASVMTNNIGNIYRLQQDNHKALKYYLMSLKMSEELGDKASIASTTGNIGIIYSESLVNYPKALEYYYKALKIDEELGLKPGIARMTGNIGNVYTDMKEYRMAKAYYDTALKMAEEIGAKGLVASNLHHIGILYLSIISDPASKGGVVALPAGMRAPDVSIPVGKAALLRGALDYLQRSLVIAKEINEPERIKKSYEGLEWAYRLSGDYKKALTASDHYHAIIDSMFSKENTDKIAKMSLQNEFDKKAAVVQKEAALKLLRQRIFTYIGIGGMLLLLVFSLFIFRERRKSERLLLNILPGEVATELKNKGTTTARHYDNVTVLFTDFVNFTEAGERMSPQELIDELHTCFKAFDEITSKYNIEKIKTIGDAYLAAAGVPSPNPKHAENVVRAATEIYAFMTVRMTKVGSGRTFRVRLGIHTGSVVAGIVGVKKFAYDIWGDTVNTAARMEQHGEAGRINISQTTYELVKDKFTCEYRGEVEAKGKGVMKMYFVG